MKKITRWMLPLIVSLSIGVPVVASYIIPDGSITTAKLNANFVDNSTLEVASSHLRIKDGGVTQAKRVALGQQASSQLSTTTTSTTFVDITNATVTITTTGRPVMVFLKNYPNAGAGSYVGPGSSGASCEGFIRLLGGASGTTSITDFQFQMFGSSAATTNCQEYVPCSSVSYMDTPAAGTWIYKLQWDVISGTTMSITNCQLVAYEL